MTDSRLATQAQLELDRTEQVIGAEGALKREEMVAWVRIVAILGWALTMTAVDVGQHAGLDRWRVFLGPGYLLWAIGVLRGVRGAVRQPRTSSWLRTTRVWALVLPAFDTLICSALLLAPEAGGELARLPALYPERAAATFLLVIAFALARPDWRYVVYTAVLAETAFLVSVFLPRPLYGGGPSPDDPKIWVSVLYVTVGFVLVAVLVTRTLTLMREDFRGVRRLSNLKRFLPAQIAERVYRGGDALLAPVSREVTVMFTDLRDFTAQSETMPPSEVLALLDFYFGHMTQIVKGHDGVVGKFIGDGMLAFWGVPETHPRHAEAALKAALDMRTKLEEINRERAQTGLPPLRIGVGVHTGLVAAGMLGGAALSEYTVLGDTVNLASRIEGLNKQHGTDILASDATWAQAGAAFEGERLGEDHVKGRERPVLLYRVVGLARR